MAKPPAPADDPLDGMSAEVNRLLKQLPGADPSLRGSGPSRSPGSPPPSAVPIRPGVVTAPAGAAIPREPTVRDKMAVWLKVGLAVLASAVMSQWPYAHGCGFSLYLYLAAVAVIIVAAGWGSVSSWKLRMGAAHVASLLAIFWGFVLVAQQVLPRVGYAAAAASWRCL